MSIANKVDEIIKKRNEKVDVLVEREAHISEVIALLDDLQEQKDRMLDNKNKLRLNTNVLECIENLDIQPCQEMWKNLQKEFGKVRRRFSRETINIAVIGEARQGKSKLLQTISGLDDKVIPAFVTSDCTGTTSMIKNVEGEKLRADITFRTELEMISSVQAYLDEILGKNVKRIGSFQEIGRLDLDAIKQAAGRRPVSVLLEHLKKYVEHFDEWSGYVKSGEPVSITDAEEIKTFVAQHNGKGEKDQKREDYYKYLAVKKAEISCEFNYADAGKIVLQDTIGLGDTSLGIEEAMLKAVRDDSDAAIIIKRPEQGTGKFDDKDYQLYNKLYDQFDGKNMGKWLFWLINETKGKPYGDNHDRCESVKQKIQSSGWELAGFDIVDASDIENVNNDFLPMVLQTLVNNLDGIDSGILADLECMANSLYREYEKLQSRITDIMSSETKNAMEGSNFVDDKWNGFYNQTLMKRLKDYRNDWRKRSKDICVEFKEYIENILRNARKEIPDIEKLKFELEAGGHSGEVAVYEGYLKKLRTDFTSHFLDIDEQVFDKMILDIKKEIVDMFAEDGGGRMKYMRPIDETRPRIEWLSYALIDDLFKGERYRQFRMAFQVLNDFKLSVRGFLMHMVRNRVKRLDIEEQSIYLSNSPNTEEQAKEIRRLLDRKVKETCEELNVELDKMYITPNGILAAVVEELYDRLCFSSIGSTKVSAEVLWKTLYKEYCGMYGERSSLKLRKEVKFIMIGNR